MLVGLKRSSGQLECKTISGKALAFAAKTGVPESAACRVTILCTSTFDGMTKKSVFSKRASFCVSETVPSIVMLCKQLYFFASSRSDSFWPSKLLPAIVNCFFEVVVFAQLSIRNGRFLSGSSQSKKRNCTFWVFFFEVVRFRLYDLIQKGIRTTFFEYPIFLSASTMK